MEEKFLEIHQPAAGFPIVGGGHGGQGEEHPPHSMIFLNPSPSKLIPPMGHTPHLKMKVGGGTALSCED